MIASTWPVAAVVTAVVISGIGLAAQWWHARRRRPLSADWCAVCFVDLPVGGVYEVRSDHVADDEFGTGGGTYLVRTYCRRHAPRGSVRV